MTKPVKKKQPVAKKAPGKIHKKFGMVGIRNKTEAMLVVRVAQLGHDISFLRKEVEELGARHLGMVENLQQQLVLLEKRFDGRMVKVENQVPPPGQDARIRALEKAASAPKVMRRSVTVQEIHNYLLDKLMGFDQERFNLAKSVLIDFIGRTGIAEIVP